MKFSPFCLSSYLAFRYLAKEDAAWSDGCRPEFPRVAAGAQQAVGSAAQIQEALRASLSALRTRQDVGLLLSGGMDSAILAAFLPEGTPAYTIRFEAPGAVDESVYARRYAAAYRLNHSVISVTWDDYVRHVDFLMKRKKAPLHAVEVALFLAAAQARRDGIRTLVLGNGADSTFGGLDKLLSRDWTFDEFVQRYSFLKPEQCLCEPAAVRDIFETYRRGDGIDVMQFLKVVHGLGIVQAFDNAIRAGGCSTVEPFEQLRLEGELDLARIRNGESKYLVRELFRKLYPDLETPEKVPFARPMDHWLSGWQGPLRKEFRSDIPFDRISGDQKWLLWCLNRFLDLQESGPI
jgi:asparagine synthetase B (glutamine-hydrolysing)